MRTTSIITIILSVIISISSCCNGNKNDKAKTIESDSLTNVKYETYYNDRFGFLIDYPSFMTLDPPPTNSDGQIFRHGNVEMRAYGGFDMTEDDITKEEIVKREFEASKRETDTYTLLKDNYYVVSGVDKDGMKYFMKRTLHTNAATVWYTYYIKFPVDEKGFYYSIILHCLESFDITVDGIYEQNEAEKKVESCQRLKLSDFCNPLIVSK